MLYRPPGTRSVPCRIPVPKCVSFCWGPKLISVYIFALISVTNAFNLSMSVFCCGHPIDMPSSAFGLGIYAN
jgi:hypothetical protein